MIFILITWQRIRKEWFLSFLIFIVFMIIMGTGSGSSKEKSIRKKKNKMLFHR